MTFRPLHSGDDDKKQCATTSAPRKEHGHLTEQSVVETAERGREFAFTRTDPAGGTIRWFYRFEPGPGGTTAELGYQVLKPVPVFLHLSLLALLGVRDLRADLHQNMTTSLQKLARIAERQAQQAHAGGRD